MNESVLEHANLELAKTEDSVRVHPGNMLRAAREAQGLHIGALAVALKVPVKKLEALEADRLDLLPDIVFVRALTLSVCRALKIDATPIMVGLPQLHAPPIKTDESGLNASFKSPGGASNSALMTQLTNPVGIGVLLSLVMIVVILLWPTKPAGGNASTPRNEVSVASSATKPSDLLEAPSLPPADLQAPIITMPPTLSRSATVRELVEKTVSESTGVLSASTLANSPVTADEPIGSPVLLLNSHGVSWVEVTDAKGLQQMRKTTSDGEVLRISGTLPLSVVLGRADMVSVLVRGKPLDLTLVSKDNVARFEVK